MKKITEIQKKTLADHERIAKLEYECSLLVDEAGKQVSLPCDYIEAIIRDGGRKFKKGKVVEAHLVAVDDAPLILPGGKGLTFKQAIKRYEEYKYQKMVKVRGNLVLRTRPMFRQWKFKPTVQFNDEKLKPDDILRFLSIAGREIAVGDWRPRFGKFNVAVNK